MQNLTRLVNEFKKKGGTQQQILNMTREYLQVLILKAIYQSKYGKGLSFMGGTCLRICHGLPRYSEDLDFALDRKTKNYSFIELNKIISDFLKNTGFEVDVHSLTARVVQKSFIRVDKILNILGLSPLKSQKIHIKIEVDTNPVKITSREIETFFVTKFDEIFPIIKHTDPTMFAGKIMAVLNRTYVKGRDFYDLIWYLKNKTDINFKYLKKALKHAGLKQQLKERKAVLQALTKRIQQVNPGDILKDIGRFLEDPAEERWLKNYQAVFKQLSV